MSVMLALLATALATENLPAAHRASELPAFFVQLGTGGAGPRFVAKGSGLAAAFAPAVVSYRAGKATVRLTFPGANRQPDIVGEAPQSGKVNFLVGAPEKWRKDLATYAGLAYRDLYRGIDLHYGEVEGRLKSEFRVAPGADPGRIRIRYEGAEKLRLLADGSLALAVGGESIHEEAPVAFQMVDGVRIAVAAEFTILADGTVGFRLGEYDPERELVIDPVLAYTTLMGGRGMDTVYAVAADASGNAYLAGRSDSYDLPVINGAQSGSGGGSDGFVAKLNASGKSLLYCTYIGGVSDDRAYALTIDTAGSAYVTGTTYSRDFPVRTALQSRNGGTRNAFVAKLSAAGNSLVFSTYLGGAGSDQGNGVALDPSGNIYVVGDTTSSNFPTTAYQRTNQGLTDGFVVKINAAGRQILYGTYFGGTADDHIAAVAVDNSGQVTIAGSTQSTGLPTTAGQRTSGGRQDAFVARFNASGSALLFCSYLGGSGGGVGYPEEARAVTVDSAGNAYVAGVASSTNFPVVKPLQSSLRGMTDAFVAIFSSSGAVTYATLLGGIGWDSANAIALDSSGAIFVAGETTSTDLPVVSAAQSTNGGDYDAFLIRLAPAGASMTYASYLGGSGADSALALAVDTSGNVIVAGQTQSTNLPANGFQTTNSGNFGGFVAKFVFTASPAPTGISPASGSGTTQTFHLSFSDPTGATSITSAAVLFNTSATETSGCAVLYNRSLNTLTVLTDAGATPSTVLTPGGSGTVENSQCTLAATGSAASVSGNSLTVDVALTFKSTFSGAKNSYLKASNSSGSSGWQMLGSWTIPATTVAPTATAVAPASGSGASQSFVFTFGHANGYGDIKAVELLVGPLAAANSCYFQVTPTTKALLMANDGGTWTGPVTLGASGTLQNSQCSIDAAASSVSGSGVVLTVSLAITFKSAFAGSKGVWMLAYGSGGTSSQWQQKGTWTVTTSSVNQPPQVSVSPSSGSGSSQTFTFAITDPDGYTNVAAAEFLIGPVLGATNSCYIYYQRSTNQILLASDAGSWGSTRLTLGGSGSLSNSQCSINAASSSASGSGSVLSVNLAITFTASYVGAATLWMNASDAANASTNWQAKGTWTVTTGGGGANHAPTATSVSPSSGSGASQLFTFMLSDSDGYADITNAQILIGPALGGTNSCYLTFYRSTGTILFANDSGTWGGAAALGSSSTVSNSQCSIDLSGSSATAAGNDVTLRLSVGFKTSYAGSVRVWMVVEDASHASSDWREIGAWTVPGSAVNRAPQAVSVTPSSGTASSQTFTFLLSDADGYADISGLQLLIGTQLAAANSCYIYYNRPNDTLYLASDAGSWQTPVSLGASSTLQNSQCSLNSGSSSKSVSGNNLTLNLAITFKSGYASSASIWMLAEDAAGANSGWQQRGVWTNTGATPTNQKPAAVSVTPSSGSGGAQTFSFAFSDGNGYSDIVAAQLLIGPVLTASNSCYFYFNRSSNAIYLASNAGSWTGPVTLGSSSVLQNSQCTLNTASSSSSGSGNTLTVNLSITFSSGYSGAKASWMEAADAAGLSSDWQQRGSWTSP
jgi:hypothetical protein